MISRPAYLSRLREALRRAPITALLGPRQVGKTTLSQMALKGHSAFTLLDLQSVQDRRRLENPELVLGEMRGLVVLDEIQLMPELFSVLRVLVDRKPSLRFLLLGSASPAIIRKSSETLAGRVEFVELSPFDITEVPERDKLWIRGGFPRSFLAASETDSLEWRESFIRTFLERDIPQLDVRILPLTLRRAWTMFAHYHGQIWNASEIGRSLGVTYKTVREYADLLTGAFVIRQLQPWHENLSKRQVKAPKMYIRDTGLLHSLLSIHSKDELLSHPRLGASWEGFVIEQILRASQIRDAYFWASHQGAELDLFLPMGKVRFGVEVKFQEAPSITPSMKIAVKDLRLEHLWVVYPGKHRYKVDRNITVIPLEEMVALARTKFEAQLRLPLKFTRVKKTSGRAK